MSLAAAFWTDCIDAGCEMQVDQENVAIVQPAEDECRNKGIEDGRRYAATNASQLT